jgi:hypothetical protein
MKDIKFNTHYIVTKGDDILTFKGDTLLMHFDPSNKNTTLGEYILFLPRKATQKPFFGLPPLHQVLYYHFMSELVEVLKDTEVKYNTELAQALIDKKQREIDVLRKNHEILII